MHGDSFGAHPKKRRAVVTRAKELLAEQFPLFVIGLYDDDPFNWLSYNLNWAAYYGGTDNPLAPNTGDPAVFTPPADACVYADGAPDPGAIPLSGYAFLAKNGPQINEAMRKIKDMIMEAKYSFSTPSVASSRTGKISSTRPPSACGDPSGSVLSRNTASIPTEPWKRSVGCGKSQAKTRHPEHLHPHWGPLPLSQKPVEDILERFLECRAGFDRGFILGESITRLKLGTAFILT
jgi:hypothetical protein